MTSIAVLLAASRIAACGGSTTAGSTANDSADASVDGADATAGSGGVAGTGAADTGADGPDIAPVHGAEGKSCSGGLDCGGVSCCSNILIPGGTFPMGRSESGTDQFPGDFPDEQPEHGATVDDFFLDEFEVTVGRFRKFVQQYDATPPVAGAGDHHGLGGGWQTEWNKQLPDSQTDLMLQVSVVCDAWSSTWTDEPGANERYALNCVPWYLAFAFCVWDGGRLPTEAELEYAAAGGESNRLYPWGNEDPSANAALANDCYSDKSPFVNVGSHPLGAGLWGHQDLAGGVSEWALDRYDSGWYAGAGNACSNCANLTNGSYRVVRGEGWTGGLYVLRAARRVFYPPASGHEQIGFRCVRTTH